MRLWPRRRRSQTVGDHCRPLTPEARRSRVAAGITLLDERVPDWIVRLDLVTLDMGSMCSCVLGQLTGSYAYAIDVENPFRLVGGDDEAIALGFALCCVVPDEEAREYDRLTEHWREVVVARRLAASKPTEQL